MQATYWKIFMSLKLYTSTGKKKVKEGGREGQRVEESSTFPLKKKKQKTWYFEWDHTKSISQFKKS